MSASQFASFAAYTPPPDEFDRPSTSIPPRPSNAWFNSHPPEVSYQSGAIPTFQHNPSVSAIHDEETPQTRWETRYGWRVDILALSAYLLGPVSALALLIVETQNDYVRFHAYQSALITTPLILLRIVFSLLQFPSWIRSVSTFIIIFIQFVMSLYAYRDASRNNLVPFHAPLVGNIAEKWLAEE